jgi:hypothetical protein
MTLNETQPQLRCDSYIDLDELPELSRVNGENQNDFQAAMQG